MNSYVRTFEFIWTYESIFRYEFILSYVTDPVTERSEYFPMSHVSRLMSQAVRLTSDAYEFMRFGAMCNGSRYLAFRVFSYVGSK